jgi:hypothetical protein
VVRAIRHADGTRARFRGTADWRAAEVAGRPGLVCEERGRLAQGGATMEAVRVTLWSVEDGRLAIRLADGRPFCAASERWERHDCPPDAYLVRHGFALWPRWTVRWRVSGPRKAWRALALYARPERVAPAATDG